MNATVDPKTIPESAIPLTGHPSSADRFPPGHGVGKQQRAPAPNPGRNERQPDQAQAIVAGPHAGLQTTLSEMVPNYERRVRDISVELALKKVEQDRIRSEIAELEEKLSEKQADLAAARAGLIALHQARSAT